MQKGAYGKESKQLMTSLVSKNKIHCIVSSSLSGSHGAKSPIDKMRMTVRPDIFQARGQGLGLLLCSQSITLVNETKESSTFNKNLDIKL
ncbi:hypothetical protein RRG08_063903 [Elysia crispata]|uniref:Uncharacterized protein n=1 Tax=Elysia crispata TaxID=231223 RepID=A0AAE1CXY7_9GAST|nr:hypothetical protein RRG08_063903 [Elysia crispata]